MHQSISFSSGTTDYYFNEPFEAINTIAPEKNLVIITDKDLFSHYREKLERYKTVVIPAGESSKSWERVRQISEGLINYEVDKSHLLIGVGGGMITDITGFVAATYMRGLEFGLVPTSLLGMVDASIGGKNGVNIDVYKNMMGTIRQPKFILYDAGFLQTLPPEEWSNGFAEIIKYGCILDKGLLEELDNHTIRFYKEDPEALRQLILRCVSYKNHIVQEDEQEKGVRKLLNFGHTVGHAIENNYGMAHGKAVAIGMVIACRLSETIGGLPAADTTLIKGLLRKYELPVTLKPEVSQIMQTLKMDKKRKTDTLDFIILERLGQGAVRTVSFRQIEAILQQLSEP